MHLINLKTRAREELIEITDDIINLLSTTYIESGMCIIYTPHTTAAVTINENADPDVQRDIIKGLESLSLEKVSYKHGEGNSPAHIKSSLLGCSLTLIIDKGKLILGKWQGIFFCEFDGPRNRIIHVKMLNH